MNYKSILIIFSACLPLISSCRLIDNRQESSVDRLTPDTCRNRKLVNIVADDLISIEWVNNAGRKEVIQKEDNQWHYAGMEKVDSAAFDQYLNGLVHVQGSACSNLISTQELRLLEKLTLYGNNMGAPAVISAFMNNNVEKPFLIHSSANQNTIFFSDSSGIYHPIFKDLRQFWLNGQ